MIKIQVSNFVNFEEKIINQIPNIIVDDLYEYVFSCSEDAVKQEKFKKLKSISMLHIDTLLLLNLFGRAAKKGILEIGPYVGGSTISAALDSNVPVVTIEPGGTFKEQPSLPSSNIIKDFISNVVDWNVDKKIKLIRGVSYDPLVIEKVNTTLHSVDLFILDADGLIERDIQTYHHLLEKNCIIAIDDYVSNDAKSKQIRESVDKLVFNKTLEPCGVFMWGTWFGRYLKP